MDPEQFSHQNKTVIIICGPTAVGKTAVSIALAKELNTEIINADSRQIYNQLNIGVAKPTEQELNSVKHHLIGSHDISELYGAGDFEKEALALTFELFKKLNTIVMCGGTGMYIRAFCDGLDDLPKADEQYRIELKEQFDLQGITYLQNELVKRDPDAVELIDFKNPQRLMRALEIMKVGGVLYSKVLAGKKEKRPFNILKVGLKMDREKLYSRINLRVDEMMKQGLLEEVKGLQEYRSINALKTVGYNELFDYLEAKWSLEEAVIKIKQHTRNYAKRQLTWYRSDEEITWFEPTQLENLISFVKSKLN